jgi:hypothetical protein
MTWPPSFKRSPVRVTVSGSDDKTEAARLRARLAELEATDEDRQRELVERYANALREERHGALLKLAQCEAHDPDTHEEEMVFSPDQRPSLQRMRLSWGQRAELARAHVAAIDAELERVQQGSFAR